MEELFHVKHQCDLQVYPIPALADNYIWAITQPTEQNFYCVDPGDAKPVITFGQQRNLKLSHVLLTHHHDDHIGGLEQLQKTYPELIVYGPEDHRIPTHAVPPGSLQLGRYHFKIFKTPGHTSSHICYFETKYQWLFCGDTLFSGGCGRVFDGSMKQLFHSLMTLRALPDDTLVFCAHEYTLKNLAFSKWVEPDNQEIMDYMNRILIEKTTCTLPSSILREKAINPFFRYDHEAMVTFANKNHLNFSDKYAIFEKLRLEKNHF